MPADELNPRAAGAPVIGPHGSAVGTDTGRLGGVTPIAQARRIRSHVVRPVAEVVDARSLAEPQSVPGMLRITSIAVRSSST